MNLKEIKMLIDNKTKEIGELVNKRNSCLTNTYRFQYGADTICEDKFLVNAPHEYTVDELTAEIEKLNDQVLKLRETLYTANDTTMVTFNGNEIRLATAIFKLKQLKDKYPSYKRLGDVKESRNIISPNRYNEDTQTYLDITKTTYDTKVYRELAKKIEDCILLLQSVIDKANVDTQVEITL